ncbi:V/A-type H+-transporting ATPase subunit B [Peptoclostridium litorale DSM 5388]|uniref:V-type ATP synthase beta chain n=1 Tax=Peptoclostridium litorale DSM 5388 TaxID=1121324 RepID=A0A069RDE5_PEPLI|nr:V-type ATP synthase subunit B [Peptoclostridium litorale]KDR94783.1 V-type ATP synthase beta chain 2 [Peptoclostridium litorale DSM 5388]SIN92591.1 V/A-type H+-transporting ATPase subunit B [Peptoclostridium litorale DSM 5388]
MKKEYLFLDKIEGPLIMLSGIEGVSYGEIIDIIVDGSEKRSGKVVKIDKDVVIAQVFEGTSGISTRNSSVHFTGNPLQIPLSREVLGRVFDGVGRPIDGGPVIYTKEHYNVNGNPINPVSREYPRNFVQTGISAIDCLTTLIRGQKLPIFSGNGLPHNELAAQIVKQARISADVQENFAIIFAAMGVKHDDADYFKKTFEQSGALERVVMFINLADDPVVERLSLPRCALTAAEYLAFEKDMHILVILTDITSYCEALREISSAREEVPSRKGYPGYLYSDLATLYERAGMMKGRKGSITLLPILTMPSDDITHPVPDLTGYITEGQVVLSRDLFQKNIYPPINVLPSLSRLMKDGIGEGYTRDDHDEIANQLFSSYSRVQEVRALAQIIGEEDLSEMDQRYMEFGRKFENTFLSQQFNENRDIEQTLDKAWETISILPLDELDRLKPETIGKYLGESGKSEGS